MNQQMQPPVIVSQRIGKDFRLQIQVANQTFQCMSGKAEQPLLGSYVRIPGETGLSKKTNALGQEAFLPAGFDHFDSIEEGPLFVGISAINREAPGTDCDLGHRAKTQEGFNF
jgi:hypothetical protein